MADPGKTTLHTRSVLVAAAERLASVSETARLDAEVLLCFTLGWTRLKLITSLGDPISEAKRQLYLSLIERRFKKEPVAYITGHKEFYGRDFIVSSAVLVPRPETELVVFRALEIAEGRPDSMSVLDLGTGSGCIALSIAAGLKDRNQKFEMLAVDKDLEALKVAQANSESLGLGDAVCFQQSDWFSALRTGRHQGKRFDLIVSNPPYVNSGLSDLPEDLRYEPQHALYAEDSGLADVKKLIAGASEFMLARGHFLCEIGCEQRPALEAFLNGRVAEAGCRYKAFFFHQDLSGRDRMLEIVAAENTGTCQS